MVSNVLSGKAGAFAGKPRVARGGCGSVRSVGNEHGTPFIENWICSWGEGCVGAVLLPVLQGEQVVGGGVIDHPLARLWICVLP